MFRKRERERDKIEMTTSLKDYVTEATQERKDVFLLMVSGGKVVAEQTTEREAPVHGEKSMRRLARISTD